MNTSWVFVTAAALLAASACGPRRAPARSGADAARSEPVRPTRTGPACDTLAARVLAQPDSFSVVAAQPRAVIIPGSPRPKSVVGRTFRVSFLVQPTGKIDAASLAITPEMGSYRAELERAFLQMEFWPGVLDGCAVPSRNYLNVTL